MFVKDELYFPDGCEHGFDRDYQQKHYNAAIGMVPPDKREVAVDIGAHVGIFSRRMAEDFRKVVAFEPIPENYECLKENVPDNVITMNVAISRAACVMAFDNPAPTNSGAWESVEGGHVNSIARPLDTFGLGKIGLIKIDVQNNELGVLEGAEHTLRFHHPVVLVEDKERKTVPFMESLGYRIAGKVNKEIVYDFSQ